MKKHLFFFVLLLSIIATACKPQCPPLTEMQKADIEMQVRAVVDSMIICQEKLDVAGLSNFISSDEFLVSFGLGLPTYSKEGFIDSVRVHWSPRESHKFDQVKVKVTVLSADFVLADRSGVNTTTYKDGRIRRTNSAVSYVFKKEGAGWKFIHYHESWQVIQWILK